MNDSNHWEPESSVSKCPHCHYRTPTYQKNDTPSMRCVICRRPLTPMISAAISSLPPSRKLRLLARGIDYLLIFLGLLSIDSLSEDVFHRAFHWLSYGILTVPQVTTPLMVIYGVSCIYFVLFHSLSGQTIGKWCCGIIVLSPQLQPISILRQLFRELVVGLTFLMEWLWIILLFSSKRRGVHDWIAGSQVYSVFPPGQDPASVTTGVR